MKTFGNINDTKLTPDYLMRNDTKKASYLNL